MSRKPIANPLLDVDGDFDPVNLVNPYAYVTGGGAFDPLSIMGCVLWLKADGNVYTTGTTQATDGQDVTTWADASASNATVTQGTSGKRPVFKTNIVNGNPVIRFAVVAEDHMEVTTDILSGATSGTAFGVIKLNNDPPSSPAIGTWLRCGTSGDSDHYPFVEGTVYSGLFSSARKAAGNPTPSLASWHVASAVSAASDWRFYVSGGLLHSTSSNTFAVPGSSPYAVIAKDSTLFLDGDIAEILVYNSALSTGDREAVENYLGAKYGITITH